MTTINDLPFEMLCLIAEHDEFTYRAMLTLKAFALKLKPMNMIDFRCKFGHTVEIESMPGLIDADYPVPDKKAIGTIVTTLWTRNGIPHRRDGFAIEQTGIGKVDEKYECRINGIVTRVGKPAYIAVKSHSMCVFIDGKNMFGPPGGLPSY